jgi:hypothetical protein
MPLTQPYSPHTPATMRTSRGEIGDFWVID